MEEGGDGWVDIGAPDEGDEGDRRGSELLWIVLHWNF